MDQEELLALGELNVVWASLDYILRLVLKRLEGLSMLNPKNQQERDRIEVIFGKLSHGPLIDQITKCLTGPSHIAVNAQLIQTIIDKVGRNRSGTGLYATRNKYIHALWARTSDGQEIRQKIGSDDWRAPIHFNAQIIQNLTREIRETALTLNGVTYHNRKCTLTQPPFIKTTDTQLLV